jgi:predicted transcriptional regulator
MAKDNKTLSLAEEFIYIFNEIDSHLRKISKMDQTASHMFVVDQLAERNKLVRNHKEELKMYARLRNAIVHNPFGSEINIIAEPHPDIVEKYRALKDRLMHPTMALAAAIQPKRIYSTTMDANARDVMRVMAKRNFSYVPVLDRQERILGIFSENTVFLYLTRNEICAVDDKTSISEFIEYLPLDRHVSECFEFVAKGAALDDVRDLFERRLDLHERLAVVFITESGRADEPILGMLTAWDIAGNNK